MTLDPAAIRKMAEGYTEAWCSRSGEAVASFFAENGTSIVNGAAPTDGRAAIAAEMGAYFEDSSYGPSKAPTAGRAGPVISCGSRAGRTGGSPTIS